MKLAQISDFKLGRTIQGFYFCNEKHLRYTRNGDLFLDMIFSDSTGTIHGKLWDLAEQFQDRFKRGDPVAVKGKVTEFNDILQLTVTQVNQATDRQYSKYGYSLDLLIRKVEEPIDSLWKSLYALIDTLSNPYKKLTQIIFKVHKQKISVMPRSVSHHHMIRGGFIKHLVTIAQMSLDNLSYYPTLDKDLVLCGIFLHDIGKIKGINDDLQTGYSDEGRLIGYAGLGMNILRDAALSCKNIPENILLKLEHIILTNEWGEGAGNLADPQFPEALFIHYMYALDSQMDIMQNAIASGPNLERMSSHKHFHSELYKK